MLFRNYRKFISTALLLVSVSLLSACDDIEEDLNNNLAENESLVLTQSYRVAYTSDITMVKEGKNIFEFSVSDLTTGDPISGLNISVMPMMTMASGMMHDSPVSTVTDNGNGNYQATVYYLMPSSMMNGDPMGDWDLRVMIGGMNGETASFAPDVMMAMGDSVKAVLLGQTDSDMVMTQNRKYFLFKESLTGMTGNHTFSLFLATRESMMSHVAVYQDAVLNQGTANELTVTSISVEVSTDGVNWELATGTGDGYFTVSGLAGLTNDSQGSIYTRLTVNGEQKTMNGSAQSGLTPVDTGFNDYGIFTVTPGMSMSM